MYSLVPLQTARTIAGMYEDSEARACMHACTLNDYPDQGMPESSEELAEKWPILFKNCSMLGDTYNAQKNASIIYLGLDGSLWFCNAFMIIGVHYQNSRLPSHFIQMLIMNWGTCTTRMRSSALAVHCS